MNLKSFALLSTLLAGSSLQAAFIIAGGGPITAPVPPGGPPVPPDPAAVARATWNSGFAGPGLFTVFEDFESLTLSSSHDGPPNGPNDPNLDPNYSRPSFNTAVGTFSQVTPRSATPRYQGLRIDNGQSNQSPYQGRFNTTPVADQLLGQYLENNDSREMMLTITAPGIVGAGFYIIDPNDQGGRVRIRFRDGSFVEDEFRISTSQPNGSVWFIGYNGLPDQFIDSIFWRTEDGNVANRTTGGDGFAIDDFQLYSTQPFDDPAIPEPSTYLLLGSGLVALAVRHRRRR